MRAWTVAAILIFSIVSASAQFGIRAKYNTNSFSDWEQFIPEIGHSNIEIGADYFFKLKTRRIEFMPEVYYGLNSVVDYYSPADLLLNFEHSYIGFQFNTNIYIFDLASDCDCPTSSKDGPSIKKGFFFSIAPGVVYNKYQRTTPPVVTEPDPSISTLNARLAVGAGYDIGITDLLTITPFINYAISLGNDAAFYSAENEEVKTNWTTLQAGIRVGFRPDYVKRYGR